MATRGPVIRKVVVCGCGLIGGSILLDLQKTAGKKVSLVAFDRPRVLATISRDRRFRGTVDGKFRSAVDGADIVVLAAGHAGDEAMLKRLGKTKSLTECLIIDTGAVKRPIADLARGLSFAAGTAFLPTHPMAGKEKAGFANAEPGIFRDLCWFFDDGVELGEHNVFRREWLFNKTGATPVCIESGLHDELVAEISHLPQLLSSVLGAQVNPEMIALAGPGLKSMLRLAGSPHAVWAEIIDQNREKIVESLSLYRDNLTSVIELIRKGESIKEVFEAAARSYRCLS